VTRYNFTVVNAKREDDRMSDVASNVEHALAAFPNSHRFARTVTSAIFADTCGNLIQLHQPA